MRTTDELRLAPYRRAVEERICSLCNDLDVHGRCARPEDDPCALVAHLAATVDAVLSVGGRPDVDPYLEALRTRVCPGCLQDADGRCARRDVAQCAADAYLLPLIEAIEETRSEAT